MKELIEKYKSHLKQKQLTEEIYKWELLAKFKGRPDPEAPDLEKELKAIDFANLIYHNGKNAIYHVAKDRTEGYRNCLRTLFNEELELSERVVRFDRETKELYRELVPDKYYSHHQDERTIATFLTYQNPNKYTFYKNSFYRKLCDYLDRKHKKKGQKYVHYLELVDELINDYIIKDQELQQLITTILPDNSFQDQNHLILAQDILYQTLEKKVGQKRNYWRIGTRLNQELFWDEMKQNSITGIGWKGIGDLAEQDINSSRDIKKLLSSTNHFEGDKTNLTKKANEIYEFYDVISEGDIILAQDGQKILGIGIVNDAGYNFNDDQEFAHQLGVNWMNQEVDFQNKEGLQTTVKRINDQKIIKSVDDYIEGTTKVNHKQSEIPLNQILYGPPGTGKTYFLNQLKENYTDQSVKKSEKEVINEIAENNSWWKLVAAVLFIKGESKVPNLVDHPVLLAKHNPDTPTKANAIIWGQLQTHSETSKYANKQEPFLFTKNEGSVWSVDKDIIKEELTDILELVNEIKNISKTDENKQRIVERYNFVTFHQSFTYEDFVEGIKPKLSHSEDEGGDASDLGYAIEKGIFYRACLESLKLAGYNSFTECYHDSKANRIEKFKNAKPYALFIDEINRGNISAIFGELITLIETDKRIGGDQEIWTSLPYDKSIKFSVPPNLHLIGTMNTADRSVEALDTALRRRFTFTEIAPDPNLLSSQFLIWRLFWDYKDSEWNEEPYASIEQSLFNLLAIESNFIEEGKERIWENWRKSGKDKSQISDLNGVSFTGINFASLLTTINDRIELLIDKDHKIGHSYFLSIVGAENTLLELHNIFYNKVIPLLQEYFYGDFGKIGLVLGKDFVKKTKGKDISFANFKHEDKSIFQEKELYEIIKYDNDNSFLEAIKSIYELNTGNDE